MIHAERQRSTPQRATLQSVERRVTYHILLMIRGPYRFRGRYAMGGPGVLSPWRRLAAALASLMRPTDRSRGRPTPGSRFRPDRPRLVRQVSATALVLVVTACGPGRSSVATASPSELDDAAWQVLARPRVPQLTGAVRISVGEIALLDENPWGLDPPVPSSVGISELVATGLLRRRDVQSLCRGTSPWRDHSLHNPLRCYLPRLPLPYSLSATENVVHREAVQPRSEPRISTERAQLLPSANEHFLRQVLREVFARHAKRQRVDPVHMTAIEAFESLVITVSRAQCVGGFRLCWHSLGQDSSVGPVHASSIH